MAKRPTLGMSVGGTWIAPPAALIASAVGVGIGDADIADPDRASSPPCCMSSVDLHHAADAAARRGQDRVARCRPAWSSWDGRRRSSRPPCCRSRSPASASVVINSYQMNESAMVSPPSGFGAGVDDDLEAAEDHPLHVERHVGRRLHARIVPHLRHAFVAHLLRRPDEPGEDDRPRPPRASTARSKSVTLPWGTSSPQHSTSRCAPCSRKSSPLFAAISR